MVLFYFCILATERVVWQVNMCILQKLEPLPKLPLLRRCSRLFLRNGYNYCLANVFREMEIAYKNGTAFREIPVKEEYGLSMLLASGFLQGCAAKHESGR